jgi:hypothetical protein
VGEVDIQVIKNSGKMSNWRQDTMSYRACQYNFMVKLETGSLQMFYILFEARMWQAGIFFAAYLSMKRRMSIVNLVALVFGLSLL